LIVEAIYNQVLDEGYDSLFSTIAGHENEKEGDKKCRR
jgi:hypothetical protein